MKLTTRDEHIVKHLILSGECQSAAEVARQAPNLGLPTVSANTVRRALRRQGLVARVKSPKPFLTKLHMRRRLEWARAHRHWSESDWRRVLFSDKTKLLLVNAHGRAWCWREPDPQPLCARAVNLAGSLAAAPFCSGGACRQMGSEICAVSSSI